VSVINISWVFGLILEKKLDNLKQIEKEYYGKI
jgi:hypothetical protein